MNSAFWNVIQAFFPFIQILQCCFLLCFSSYLQNGYAWFFFPINLHWEGQIQVLGSVFYWCCRNFDNKFPTGSKILRKSDKSGTSKISKMLSVIGGLITRFYVSMVYSTLYLMGCVPLGFLSRHIKTWLSRLPRSMCQSRHGLAKSCKDTQNTYLCSCVQN